MANRRMFSNRIANSARFLQMPIESQLLYFHLNLHADDDGIAEAYPIMKLLGVSPDSFKVLLAKNYIQQLNEDQVVVISDWLEHNVIRADRKVDSIYKHLLPEYIETIEAKPRSDVKDNSKRLGGQSTDGIGKDRLGKDRLEQPTKAKTKFSQEGAEIIKLFEEIDPKNKTYYNNKTERASADFLIQEYGKEMVEKVIALLPKTNQIPYMPSITKPSELKEKWHKLKDAIAKKQVEKLETNNKYKII